MLNSILKYKVHNYTGNIYTYSTINMIPVVGVGLNMQCVVLTSWYFL